MTQTEQLLAKLDELAAVEAKATPGPWAFWAGSVMYSNTPLLFPEGPHFENDCQHCANVEFTVQARNSLPSLIALVRALVEEREASFSDYLEDAGLEGRNARAELTRRSHATDAAIAAFLAGGGK